MKVVSSNLALNSFYMTLYCSVLIVTNSGDYFDNFAILLLLIFNYWPELGTFFFTIWVFFQEHS